MKLLTGITIPDPTSSALNQLRESNKHLEAIKWSKPTDYHITTYYLGEIDPIQVEVISATLASVTQQYSAMELPFKKIGFSPGKNPKMLWAYFQLTSEFQQLCNAIATALNSKMPARFKPTPHIKLASLKKSYRYYAPNFVLDVPSSLPVHSLSLWASSGTSFESIKMFPLG